jgi:zinc-binding RING finger protein
MTDTKPAAKTGRPGTWKSWSDFMDVVKTRDKFREEVNSFVQCATQTIGSAASKRFADTLDKELELTFDDRLDNAFQAVVDELHAVTSWQPSMVPICPVCRGRCKPGQVSALECGHIYCTPCAGTLATYDDVDEAEFKCPVCRLVSTCATKLYL